MPSGSAWLWISRGVSVGAETSYKCKGVCMWQNMGDCEGGAHLGCARGGKATIGLVVARRGTMKIFRNRRVSGSERIKKCPWASQPRNGSHKSAVYSGYQDYMENAGIFVTRYDRWFDTAANVLQDDRSRIVSRLKQTCKPTGAARKWVTTFTDVMILNAVGRTWLVMERNAILRACGLVDCRLTVCLYRFSPCRKKITPDFNKIEVK